MAIRIQIGIVADINLATRILPGELRLAKIDVNLIAHTLLHRASPPYSTVGNDRRLPRTGIINTRPVPR